jgi:hypothetical protein
LICDAAVLATADKIDQLGWATKDGVKCKAPVRIAVLQISVVCGGIEGANQSRARIPLPQMGWLIWK